MPRPTLALAALLVGCRSATTVVPVVELPPPPPAAEPVAEETVDEVPFLGTYPRYAVVSFKDGEAVEINNATGKSSIRIEPGRVVYEQVYFRDGADRHVVQTYTFDPRAVRRTGDAYEVALVHKSLRGDVPTYSPDSGKPRLTARQKAWGWDIVLVSTDTSSVVAGHAFGAAPPGEPGPDLTDYARRTGVSIPSPP